MSHLVQSSGPDAEPDADDEFERAFPGSVLTHVLSVMGQDPIAVALDTLHTLRAFGASLESLQLNRRGTTFEQQIRLAGLRPHDARRLCAQLQLVGGIERATVEHQFLNAQGPDLP